MLNINMSRFRAHPTATVSLQTFVHVYLLYLALCSLSQAVYIKRMATVNRMRVPTAFRPGVNLQRPWVHNRLVQAASNRAPYVLYRKSPQRYAVKHFAPSSTRNMFAGGPWKTTVRLPISPVTPEYEFVKAASSAPVVHTDGGTGAIHTIPAPNLSLSEKPIVVIESSDSPVSELPRPSYEVTEKYPENEYSVAKIESPVGFSKSTSFTTPELQTLIRNGAALQLASEYSLPAISINPHQPLHHQYPLQGLQNSLPTPQDVINTGADGLFIPPHALYQNDPMFLQKLQNQLLQRFPSVEFIPYAAEAPKQALQPEASQIHTQVVHPQHPQMMQPQLVHTQIIHPQELQPQMILLKNEQLDKPLPQHSEPKTVVQRETQENTVVTFVPQPFTVANTTEKQVENTPPPQPENITLELVASETQPPTTTVKYIIETNTEEQNTTPIYYAQVGQSVGSVIANGFYSAINDVRAAAALAQVDQSPVYKPTENVTTTTIASDLKAYFVKNDEKSDNKTQGAELKPLLGVPFTKSTNSVNVEYTLVRSDDNQPKVNQEGAVYAGQIVEATITEDQDFNKEKASLISRRAPIRLFAVDTKNIASSANTLPRVAVVKAKIPPKSKLTFDDKTGEPILRIYASYVDNPKQKDAVVSKLTNLKQAKDAASRKEGVDNWKAATIKSADTTQGVDSNHVTQFGLKLRERNDYYEPFFEDYEEL
ncbi:uncharacterized protein LOC118268241 isoform X2 [Spodoptera frugiperda]|uniref:Uncharacterized protein LOC118268241 isoform X2 n=1 Tax=Spodoptera frugiperda TaxID=7108 RepID=A0A9R0EBJ4_SPOFR|nr:uncharacterized protein LOC118268241 isoform X2 [Spodoptera frugiperda]